jgi:hypothetical protein
MKLSTPKMVTFWIAVALAVIGIIVVVIPPHHTTYAFLLELIAFLVLLAGNLLKGF